MSERKKPIQNIKTKTATTTTQKDTVKNTVAENPLEAVYTSYFALKNALTKDDGTTAAAKAKELFKAIDAGGNVRPGVEIAPIATLFAVVKDTLGGFVVYVKGFGLFHCYCPYNTAYRPPH